MTKVIKLAVFQVILLISCTTTPTITSVEREMSHTSANNSSAGSIINAKVLGAGRPIILIHGFGGSQYTWREVVPFLRNDHEVHLVDLMGFGDSVKSIDPDNYTFSNQVEIVLRYILENQLRDVTLIGNSYGGAVALLTALKLEEEHPGILSDLVLIDAAAYPQKMPWFLKVMRTPIIGPISVAILPKKFQVRLVMRDAFKDSTKISEDAVTRYASVLENSRGRVAAVATARNIIPGDINKLSAEFSRLKSRCLIIWGDTDRIVPIGVGRKLNKALPRSEFNVIENCGHMPQEECPEDVARLIYNFLNIGVR